MSNNKIWNICANAKSTGLKFCRVVVLQELHILIAVDVTIATSSLPDLYPAKMKTALFVAPEFNKLSCACAV